MKYLKLGAVVAAGASFALVLACAGGSSDTSSPLRAPGAASHVYTSATSVGQAGDGVANEGEVEVCKYGTDATFNVAVGAGAPTQFSIAKGTCKVVALDNSTDNTATSVTVTEVSNAAYTLLSVQKTVIQFQTGTTTDIVTGPIDNVPDGQTIAVNAYHGGLLVYHNQPVVVPSGHCSYTQGWYKNHTSSWPSGTLTPTSVWDGGKTIIDLFNTPPKGSQYIILAHQYITALLNIQGGSNVPPAVQAALDTAAAYFAGGGAGAGDPSVNIAGVSDILDAYNNGLALNGPAHCN
jgi:hypothetical protein